jgi:Zinc-binding loop region of homing endonuclease
MGAVRVRVSARAYEACATHTPALGHNQHSTRLPSAIYSIELTTMSQASRDFWSGRTVDDIIALSQSAASQRTASQGANRAPVSPAPIVDLPDVVALPPVGDAAEQDAETKRGAPRRSTAEMQLEMFNKGAFFFRCGLASALPAAASNDAPSSTSTNPRALRRFEEPAHDPAGRKIDKSRGYAEGLKDYRAMEEKGFRVSTDGCMFPHEQYCVTGGGATLKGHQRASFFATGLCPEGETVRKKKGKRKTKVLRDANGWPTDSQVSHRCHRSACCRPDHLQIELRPVNDRRTYCGIMKKGVAVCDCGMVPECVRMYHPADWNDPDLTFCSSRGEVASALKGLKEVFPFKLLERNDVRADALHADNARKRKRAGNASLAKSEKKAAKRKRVTDQLA